MKNAHGRKRSPAWLDKRSLAMDRVIATKLEADPARIEHVKLVRGRWIKKESAATPGADLSGMGEGAY